MVAACMLRLYDLTEVRTAVKVFTVLLFGLACLAEETNMPPCNEPNRGKLWPQRASSDAAAVRRAERCGQLFVCSSTGWKYRWTPLTVHISQLGKGPKRDIPGCAKSDEPAGSR